MEPGAEAKPDPDDRSRYWPPSTGALVVLGGFLLVLLMYVGDYTVGPILHRRKEAYLRESCRRMYVAATTSRDSTRIDYWQPELPSGRDGVPSGPTCQWLVKDRPATN